MWKRTPIAGESGLIDVELGFAQAAGVHSAAGIGDLLDMPLGKEKFVDLPAQRNIFPAGDFLSDHFEGERGVTDPSVEIVRVDDVRACNDNSGLMGGEIRTKEGILRQTNQCARRLGTFRSDVSQHTRSCNRGFFCDVRLYGRGSKEFV